MLYEDGLGTEVETLFDSVFPAGTVCRIVTCEFVGFTTNRAYCIQTDTDIKGLVDGPKTAWYLERDIKNI